MYAYNAYSLKTWWKLLMTMYIEDFFTMSCDWENDRTLAFRFPSKREFKMALLHDHDMNCLISLFNDNVNEPRRRISLKWPSLDNRAEVSKHAKSLFTECKWRFRRLWLKRQSRTVRIEWGNIITQQNWNDLINNEWR